MRFAKLAAAAALALGFLLARASSQPVISADCDGDGRVDFSEAIRTVSIALGQAPLSSCTTADRNDNGRIDIDEAVAAAADAISGGPPTPSATTIAVTPTATATGGASPTRTPSQTIPPPATSSTTPAPSATHTSAPSATSSSAPTTTPTETPTVTQTSTVTPTLPDARPLTLISPVFQINTFTMGSQTAPGVCRAADGTFTVSWFDSPTARVVAQRFADDGSRIDAEIAPGNAGIACGQNETFATASVADDGSSTGIFLRVFDASGSQVAGPFRVNGSTAGTQDQPSVCGNRPGEFVVSWRGVGTSDDVFAGRIAANGARLGTELQLNLTTAGSQSSAGVNCDAQGALFTWRDASTGKNWLVGRQTDAALTPTTGELSLLEIQQNFSSIAVRRDPHGEFVLVWQEDAIVAGSPDPHRVRARFRSASGSAIGNELQIGALTTSIQEQPTVANIAGEGFIIGWESREFGKCNFAFCIDGQQPCSNLAFPYCRDGQCCDRPDIGDPIITAQRFTTGGALLGSEFQVSDTTGHYPSAAADGDGDVVVVWQGDDGDEGGIFGRRYTSHVPDARASLVPCRGSGDVWQFAAAAGRNITVRVDTLDSVTAADLCFRAACPGADVSGDDEAPCTFAPSSFGCPQRSFVASSSGTCQVTVSTCSNVCADDGRADYALIVDADGAPLPLSLATHVVPPTPTGTPKRTPTPTATPTRMPGEVQQLGIGVYRALDDTLYVLIPGVPGRRIKLTSVALAAGDVFEHREPYSAGSSDLVVTALAGGAADTLLPFQSVQSTGVLAGLGAHPSIQAPTFDPCAIEGRGLLTLPGGVEVDSVGPGPYASAAPVLSGLAESSAGVPAAVRKRITRRIGSVNVARETYVFPAPGPSQCVGSANAGVACSSDESCDDDCTQVGQGCCARASSPPVCGANQRQICSPAEPNSCLAVGGFCTFLGGEVDGQNVTIDDALDERFGNNGDAETDGILLDGTCDGGACDAIVFVVDGAVADDFQVAAAGFVLDGDDRVIGTASGIGDLGSQVFPGSVVQCDEPREIPMNTTRAGGQSSPALCHSPDGNLVAAWGGESVRAQRFGPDGLAIGGELLLTDALAGGPGLCCRPDGGFVVVWSESGRDGDGSGVFARRFASSGQPVSSEFQVNSYTGGDQGAADVTCLPDDAGFVVAWMSGTLSSFPPGQDGSAAGVYAQRFDPGGARRGGEFQVNVQTTDPQAFPSMCSDSDGSFVVSWNSRGAGNFRPETVTRRFAADGFPKTGDVPFVSSFADFQIYGESDVACSASGDYLLAVTGNDFTQPPNPSPGADGSGTGIFGRLYVSTGATIGSELRINTQTSGDQSGPSVASDGADGFLVSWESPDQDGDGSAVVAKRFSSAGAAVGTEFVLSTVTAGDQLEPVASCDTQGQCFAAWTGPDGGGSTDVFLRRLP